MKDERYGIISRENWFSLRPRKDSIKTAEGTFSVIGKNDSSDKFKLRLQKAGEEEIRIYVFIESGEIRLDDEKGEIEFVLSGECRIVRM